MHWVGRANFRTAKECPDCSVRHQVVGLPEYRCQECFLADLVCAGCCLKRHWTQPLHWIEVSPFLFVIFQCSNANSSFRNGLASHLYLFPWRIWASRFSSTMPAFSATVPSPHTVHSSSNIQIAFTRSLSCIVTVLELFLTTCSFYVEASTCLPSWLSRPVPHSSC